MPEPRSKQACEPCRRKKSKCTAERPVCSFCQRLNQDCVYREPVPPRKSARRSGKLARNSRGSSSTLQHRFQQLESQVKGIYEILQPTSSINSEPSPNATGNITAPTPQPTFQGPNMEPNMFARPQQFPNDSSFALMNPDPPDHVIDCFIEVYRARLHLQPLPILKLETLKIQLTSSPKFLLWSFLALTLRFCGHDFYLGNELQAVEFYSTSAQQMVGKLASQGITRQDVVQSLCLLALGDVLACRPGQAWMTIGTASRLEALRTLSPDPTCDRHTSLRCYWSVFLMEKIFTSQQSPISDDQTPDFPTSACPPPPMPPVRDADSECPPDIYHTSETIEDLGIVAYYIKMISIWGHLSSYMHQVRLGKAETPWAPGSMHTRLTAMLFEHESQLPQKHLLRNLHFSKRSSTEISEQREYWIPWLLMQVVSHAAPAILNHPFIQLVAIRGKNSTPQSRLFLQQSVDLALVHSGWVFRLLRHCEDHHLEIYDPLIGHVVAVVAIIPWLFQLTSDQTVSRKAKEDLEWCKSFLARLSLVWPHISQKLELLHQLEVIADSNPQTSNDKGISVVFQPSLFWALVDPKISHMTPPSPPNEGLGRIPDARIQITTHFVHPLREDRNQQSLVDATSSGGSDESFLLAQDLFEQVYLDDLFAHFIPDMNGL